MKRAITWVEKSVAKGQGLSKAQEVTFVEFQALRRGCEKCPFCNTKVIDSHDYLLTLIWDPPRGGGNPA